MQDADFTLCNLPLQVLDSPRGAGAVSWGDHMGTKVGNEQREGLRPPPPQGGVTTHSLPKRSLSGSTGHAMSQVLRCSRG